MPGPHDLHVGPSLPMPHGRLALGVRHILRTSCHLSAQVYGKAEFLNPGGSVKDRVAVAIVAEAYASGRCVELRAANLSRSWPPWMQIQSQTCQPFSASLCDPEQALPCPALHPAFVLHVQQQRGVTKGVTRVYSAIRSGTSSLQLQSL